MWKSTFDGLKFCRWQYWTGLSSFVLFSSCCRGQICGIPRQSPKIRTYSSSKSSKVIDLGVNWKRICDFLL